jgi:predicted nucleic acid-binding protein
VIVVADAGPLIYLAAIGHLDLLRRLAPEVLVPEAVYHEVVVAGAGLPGAEEVREAAWVRVERPARPDLVEALVAGGLHAGESEAIAAKERGDIAMLAPLLQALRDSGMWLSQATIDRVLGAVGELRG